MNVKNLVKIFFVFLILSALILPYFPVIAEEEMILEPAAAEEVVEEVKIEKTDRFIVKYKSNVNEKTKNQTKSKKFKGNTGVKRTNKVGNNTNVEIIELDQSVDQKEFIEEFEEQNDRIIEYIQPDYEMELSDLEQSQDIAPTEDREISSVEEIVDNTPAVSPDGIVLDFEEDAPAQEPQNSVPSTENPTQSLTPTEDILYDVEANLQQAWTTSRGGNAVVAVLDTWIDTSHPDFAGRMVAGHDFMPGSQNDIHGTHVAGIIAKTAPDAKIMPLTVFENGKAYTSQIIQAIEYAAQNGAQIANCSWGAKNNNPALYEAMEQSSMLFVCAAGNSRLNFDETPIYPAAFSLQNVISVGSHNRDLGMSYFSNYMVDIAAPGRDIESAVPGGEYGRMSGTSMSAAYVSGAAALIAHMDNNLKQRLLNTADKLSCLQGLVKEQRKLNFNNAVQNLQSSEVLNVNAADDFDLNGLDLTPAQSWTLFSGLETVKVAAGYQYNLVLKSDGSVWSWGRNDYGQLGIGTTDHTVVPTRIGGLGNIVDIAAGDYHALALDANGGVYAWGRNNHGQLGIYSNTNQSIPMSSYQVEATVKIAAGANHSIILKETSGEVHAFGLNTSGQLGDGSNTSQNSYVRVRLGSADITNIADIKASDNRSMLLGNDGAVYLFGDNANGKLGVASLTNASYNTAMQIDSGMKGIEIGDKGWAAIRTDNTARSTIAQIEQLSDMDQIAIGGTPYAVKKQNGSFSIDGKDIGGLSGIDSFDVGFDHTIMLANGGYVYTYGENAYGQLGDGSMYLEYDPVKIMSGATQVAAGMAIKSDKTVWVWDGDYGVPTKVPNMDHVKRVFHENGRRIMVKEDGSVWQLGNDHIVRKISQLRDVIDMKKGYILQADGTVWSIGNNNFGQLGNGTFEPSSDWVQVSYLDNVKAIAASSGSAYALDEDGVVWAWGKNNYGQLGNNTTTNRCLPGQVSLYLDIIDIGAGNDHAVALRANGEVWAWGLNSSWQLGDNTNVQKNLPVRVKTGANTYLSNITAIEASGNKTAALSQSGELWVWGENIYSSLGLAGTASAKFATMLSLSNITAIYNDHGAFNSTKVIKNDGSVWAFGVDFVERGSIPHSIGTTPTKKKNIQNAVSLVQTTDQNYALTQNGDIWAWGYNGGKLMGNGRINSTDVPYLIGSELYAESMPEAPAPQSLPTPQPENGYLFYADFNGTMPAMQNNGVTMRNTLFVENDALRINRTTPGALSVGKKFQRVAKDNAKSDDANTVVTEFKFKFPDAVPDICYTFLFLEDSTRGAMNNESKVVQNMLLGQTIDNSGGMKILPGVEYFVRTSVNLKTQKQQTYIKSLNSAQDFTQSGQVDLAYTDVTGVDTVSITINANEAYPNTPMIIDDLKVYKKDSASPAMPDANGYTNYYKNFDGYPAVVPNLNPAPPQEQTYGPHHYYRTMSPLGLWLSARYHAGFGGPEGAYATTSNRAEIKGSKLNFTSEFYAAGQGSGTIFFPKTTGNDVVIEYDLSFFGGVRLINCEAFMEPIFMNPDNTIQTERVFQSRLNGNGVRFHQLNGQELGENGTIFVVGHAYKVKYLINFDTHVYSMYIDNLTDPNQSISYEDRTFQGLGSNHLSAINAINSDVGAGPGGYKIDNLRVYNQSGQGSGATPTPTASATPRPATYPVLTPLYNENQTTYLVNDTFTAADETTLTQWDSEQNWTGLVPGTGSNSVYNIINNRAHFYLGGPQYNIARQLPHAVTTGTVYAQYEMELATRPSVNMSFPGLCNSARDLFAAKLDMIYWNMSYYSNGVDSGAGFSFEQNKVYGVRISADMDNQTYGYEIYNLSTNTLMDKKEDLAFANANVAIIDEILFKVLPVFTDSEFYIDNLKVYKKPEQAPQAYSAFDDFSSGNINNWQVNNITGQAAASVSVVNQQMKINGTNLHTMITMDLPTQYSQEALGKYFAWEYELSGTTVDFVYPTAFDGTKIAVQNRFNNHSGINNQLRKYVSGGWENSYKTNNIFWTSYPSAKTHKYEYIANFEAKTYSLKVTDVTNPEIPIVKDIFSALPFMDDSAQGVSKVGFVLANSGYAGASNGTVNLTVDNVKAYVPSAASMENWSVEYDFSGYVSGTELRDAPIREIRVNNAGDPQHFARVDNEKWHFFASKDRASVQTNMILSIPYQIRDADQGVFEFSYDLKIDSMGATPYVFPIIGDHADHSTVRQKLNKNGSLVSFKGTQEIQLLPPGSIEIGTEYKYTFILNYKTNTYDFILQNVQNAGDTAVVQGIPFMKNDVNAYRILFVTPLNSSTEDTDLWYDNIHMSYTKNPAHTQPDSFINAELISDHGKYSKNVNLNEFDHYYKFTASADGTYFIKGSSEMDLTASLYAEDGTLDKQLMQSEEGFAFDTALEAGKMYYLKVEYLYGNAAQGEYTIELHAPRSIDVVQGQETSYTISAKGITDFSDYVFTVHYDQTKLDVSSLVGQYYKPALTVETYANVQIISVQPGEIVFKMVGIDIPQDKKWNGIMNIIKFTGKATGKTAVTVAYERSGS